MSGAYKLDAQFYETQIDKDWEPNFDDIKSKIKENTKMLVYVNPGNPNCISYDTQTIEKFLNLAREHNLVVLADEIYFDSVFPGVQHNSILDIKGYDDIPIILMSGLAKRFVTPGYCCEWL